MNYLAKRERILEYNRELYSDYKNLELWKKHEIYDELAGFQIPFIKKYVAEIYDRLHYDHDKWKHIFYNNYDKEIGDLNSYEVLDTNGYDILSYMLQWNDIAEIKKISYWNNYKNILRMIRRILDWETIMIQISDLTEEWKDDIKNYVLYMIESLEERWLGLVSNKIHNIFWEWWAFKVYHDWQLVAFRAILDDIQSLLPKDKDYYDTIVEKQWYYNLKLVPKRQDLLDQALEKCLLEGSQKVTSFQDYRKWLWIMERRLFLRLQETANE
jgi:hypothetical protein